MRHLWTSIAFALVVSAFVLSASALGESVAAPAPLGIVWERAFSAGEESRDFFQLLTIRRLVDDSLLAVTRQGSGASAIRFGPGGAVLSNTAFPAAGVVSSAVADAFGSVALLIEIPTSGSTNDLAVAKYDGVTGQKMWSVPARIQNVSFQTLPAAAIGPTGDVFVTAGVFGTASGRIDWATLRLDGRTGTVVWGPALYGDSIPLPRTAGPMDLSIDPSGDLVVTGFATSSDRSLWAAIKYRGATGEPVWGPVRIGVPSTAPPPTTCFGPCDAPPTAAKCAFDRNGNAFLTVSSFTAPYSQAWLTAKYEGATGNLVWGPVSHKTGTETDYDVPSAIGVNGNGDVVVAGSVHPSPYSNAINSVNELVKYGGPTGAIVWGPVQTPSTVEALGFDGGGQVVITGTSFSNYPYISTWTTATFDGRSGRQLWEQGIESADAGFSSSPAVAIGADGDVTSLVSGYVGMGTDQHPELQAFHYSGATGSIAWGPVLVRNRGAGTWPLALLPDRNGGTVLITSSGQPGSILKYARDGHDLWGPVRFPYAASSTGEPASATLDPNGDIVVASAEDGVAKYSGSDGTLIWGPTRVEGLDSRATVVNTDSSGDVLMASLSGASWKVVKFRGLTGDLLWIALSSSPWNNAWPVDLGTDLQGDIFVTGYSYDANGGSAWMTSKYARDTGTPVWGPVFFAGTFRGNNQPKKLVVDGAGDVMVAGVGPSSRGVSRETIKYSGRTGAILWGPSEIAAGLIANPAKTVMAVDGVGDILLAGGRIPDPGAPFPREFWSTVKLSGRNGQLVWGPKDFPSPTRSSTLSMAVDAEGNPSVAGSVWNGRNDEWMFVGYRSATGDVLFGPDVYDTGSDEEVAQIAIAGGEVVVAGSSEGTARTVRYSNALALATLQTDLAPVPVLCGGVFLQWLTASNGTPPYTWEITSGGLPSGVELDPFSGRLSGLLSEQGIFKFNVQVKDAARGTAERSFAIDVRDGEPYVTIEARAQDTCPSGQFSLSVPGTYVSYRWLPGGETSSEIAVCPFQPTTYSVIVIEPSGCERRGSIDLAPFRIELIARQPPVHPGPKRPQARGRSGR